MRITAVWKKCLLLIGIGAMVVQSGCTTHQNEIVTYQKEGIVLSVLAGQSTADAGVEDMINEVMTNKFPEVTLEWECVDWGSSFASQVRGCFVTGDIPDILVGKSQDVASYAKTGNLAEIPPECVAKISDEALAAVTQEGKVYGLPYNVWYQGVLYNKKIFEEFHFPVPNTQQELKMIVSKLQQEEITPFASHFQESWKIGNLTMQFFMNEIFLETPYWGDLFRESKVNFSNSEKVKACMQYSQNILELSWEDALMIDQNESDLRFAQGEAAMYPTGSWSLQFINQTQYPIDIGIFPFPNQEGNSKLIMETNMTFLKSSKTRYPELVDEIFIELATNDRLMKEIIGYTQSYSTLKDVELDYDRLLQTDIMHYQNSNRVIDVAIGNSQLVWDFQSSIAIMEQKWLKGQGTLEEVLLYADQNRNFSGA